MKYRINEHADGTWTVQRRLLLWPIWAWMNMDSFEQQISWVGWKSDLYDASRFESRTEAKEALIWEVENRDLKRRQKTIIDTKTVPI